MAFLFDHNDPSGLGMFSKIGRLSSQKILVFKKAEQKLEKKRPQTAIQTQQPKKNEIQQKQPIQTEIQPEINTPFYKQTSRQYINQVKAIKCPAPAVGYYRPKLDIVQKNHEFVYNLHHHKKNHSRVQSAKIQRHEDITKEQPSKLRKKVTGYVETGKQTARNNINLANDAHPERFLLINQSLYHSKNKKVESFQMEKKTQRQFKFTQVMNNPYYRNNFEIKKKRLNLLVPQFEKTLSRNFKDKQCLTQNEQFYQYDKYAKSIKQNSQIWKRNKTVDFKNYLNRDNDEQDPLASYSQRNINSRQQIINGQTSKSLELNYYKQGRFQTIHTGFPQYKNQSSKKNNDFLNEI